jgi:riboflavin kinase
MSIGIGNVHLIRPKSKSIPDILIPARLISVQGKVISGLGRAGYFLCREGYSRQFRDKLGYIPFPGTLNVLLDQPFPARAPCIPVIGFSEGKESFGGCQCYRIRINGLDGAVIRPEKSCHPPELIEIISSVSLRRTLHLNDGDSVEVELA